ncbi:MAG: amylo-alpha-1,6-glucosidase [Vicinamibacterales bacterium]
MDQQEWLEADGYGGYASGTASGVRTRRYHGVLLTATTPPGGRMMLVNGFDAWLQIGDRRVPLTSHRYASGVIYPDGATRMTAFTVEPWPRWEFAVEGATVVMELFVAAGTAATVLTWTLDGGPDGATLVVRPLLSGRDYHALHHENDAFNFTPDLDGDSVTWTPYEGVPTIRSRSNGTYRHDPIWFRQFVYAEEEARGLDAVEDLASPGEISWTLTPGTRAVWILSADTAPRRPGQRASIVQSTERTRKAEAKRRAAFPSPLDRAADAYIVQRGAGKTIIAGYPWFTDWGRDTFIAIRGLALATNRLEDATAILLEWSGTLADGMLPNRFPDTGDTPEFNAVDASLWFVVAAFELEAALARQGRRLPAPAATQLHGTIDGIVKGFATGTRFRIACDNDGLLAAGEPGVQLTWMDAKVDGQVVTPRTGKPVEVNALWLNALRIAGARDAQWRALYRRGCASFGARFWNAEAGGLYDVVDVDHESGRVDASVRPNQIFAVGGLPFPVLKGPRARRVVEIVEEQLLTPIGLRTLAPGSPGYAPSYEGGPWARDHAYHQGTVWPWLIGPFVEAWLRVHGSTQRNRAVARERFLAPLLAHLKVAGLGHVSEIADAEPPFTPRGCPFQAWSLGELLRLDRTVLAAARRPAARKQAR